MRTINAIKGRDEASILDKNKVAMALMRSNYTRHRAGVCLGQKRHPTGLRVPFGGTLTSNRRCGGVTSGQC